MSDARSHAWRAGRAARAAFIVTAMLISGCFSASPSVKQAMTSAAPPVTAPAPSDATSATAALTTNAAAAVAAAVASAPSVAAPKKSFDLDKPEVKRSVASFQTDLRNFFHGALARSAKYVPTMTDMLMRAGVPTELAYLPLIESGYRPEAVSPAGAVGPWQFIPETGKRYGLRIDAMVDERRDPIKSTEAAAQYLKDLHEMFGDWELSLAAYNSGEYRVARILADKGTTDYWSMRARGYLPSETSAYVPKFLAAVQIAKAPQQYGFMAPSDAPMHFEEVNVDRQLPLKTAAGLCGVSASELAELNPALRRGITPSGYALRVPKGAAEPLRSALASYTEPARASRRIAGTKGASGRGSAVARADRRRSVTARSGASPARNARSCAPNVTERPASREARATTPAPARKAAADGGRRAPKSAGVRIARETTTTVAPAKAAKSPPRARRRS